MLKLLILCKKMETAKNLTNKVAVHLKDARLIGIANSLSEAKSILKEEQPEFIISTSKEIIDVIKETFINYFPGIIFFTHKKYRSTSYKNMIIINSNDDYEFTIKQISSFINKNKSTHKEKVINILTYLGFDFKLSGTIYLLDAVLYAHTYKGSYSFEKLERDIYSPVADANNTNINRVKWSIFRAINYMYHKHTETSYQIVEKYFGLKYPTKPTPKLIISLISNNLDK